MSGEKEKRAKELLWDKESNPKKQPVRGEVDKVHSVLEALSDGCQRGRENVSHQDYIL